MSAHSLNDPFPKIVIQDELESFFHVLLYYAVRFLYHNLSHENVGHFLHNYFDDYSTHASGYRCGNVKLHAMETGVISLRSFNGDNDEKNIVLRFRCPTAEELERLAPQKAATTSPSVPSPPSPNARLSSSAPPSSPSRASPRTASAYDATHSSDSRIASPGASSLFGSELTALSTAGSSPPPEEPPKPAEPEEDHPLNDIFERLLSWFSAYYALDAERKRAASSGTNTQDVQPKKVPRQSSKWQKSIQEWTNWEVERGCSPERLPDQAKRRQTAEELAKLAANLESHTAFIRLLQEASEAKWPLIDKGPDKKPKGGYVPPKSQVPSGSVLSGSKRRSMDHEPDNQPGPSKRSRT